MGPATDCPRLLSWLRMLYITTSTSTSKVHVLRGVALLKLTLKFVCKIFTKYRVNTRAARFYAIIASPNARRAFLRDYRVPHGPAQTRTKNAIIAFACASHRVFCKKVAIAITKLCPMHANLQNGILTGVNLQNLQRKLGRRMRKGG